MNCKASGDPPPQINWIVKPASVRDPFIYSAPLPGQAGSDGILANAFEASRVAEDLGGSNDIPLINTGTPDNRIQVLPNGSLIINQVLLKDEAEYICIAGNPHAIQTRQGVYVTVLSGFTFLHVCVCVDCVSNRLVHLSAPHEYAKLEHGGDKLSPGMLRTIVIVVNCAIAYLGLIFGLAVYCSVRYFTNRRQRAQNGRLLASINLWF